MRSCIVCLIVSLIAIGCGTTKTYSLEVRNRATRPITLWLTKDGPPVEAGWQTPEELVKTPETMRYDLAFVPPGKTGFTGKLSGEFPKGTNAVLRVYAGQMEIFDLAKQPADSWMEYMLKPGKNKLAVFERGDKLSVEKD